MGGIHAASGTDSRFYADCFHRNPSLFPAAPPPDTSAFCNGTDLFSGKAAAEFYIVCTVLRRDMDRGAGHRFTALYAALAGLPAARASGGGGILHPAVSCIAAASEAEGPRVRFGEYEVAAVRVFSYNQHGCDYGGGHDFLEWG